MNITKFVYVGLVMVMLLLVGFIFSVGGCFFLCGIDGADYSIQRSVIDAMSGTHVLMMVLVSVLGGLYIGGTWWKSLENTKK